MWESYKWKPCDLKWWHTENRKVHIKCKQTNLTSYTSTNRHFEHSATPSFLSNIKSGGPGKINDGRYLYMSKTGDKKSIKSINFGEERAWKCYCAKWPHSQAVSQHYFTEKLDTWTEFYPQPQKNEWRRTKDTDRLLERALAHCEESRCSQDSLSFSAVSSSLSPSNEAGS